MQVKLKCIYFKGVLDQKANPMDVSIFREAVKSVYDWRCVVIGLERDNPMQTFYLG